MSTDGKDTSEASVAETMAAHEDGSAAPSAKPKSGTARLVVGVGVVAVIGVAVVAFVMTRGGGKDTKEPPRTTAPSNVDSGPKVDRAAARETAYEKIRAALGDTSPQIRAQACAAAGKIADRVSIPRLLGMVESDPDAEVRGQAAHALASLRATEARSVLEKLAQGAEPGLAVWFTEALALFGDEPARNHLLELAGDRDVAISFRACLALADLSAAGDDKVIGALRKLAAREAELNKIASYAGAMLLTKLARLRYGEAKKMLYTLLENETAGVRIAAAEGLAKLGDGAGKKVLKDALDDESSRYRPAAAVALVSLGDYSGSATLSELLDNQDPRVRELAARGIGEIGDGNMLRKLLGMLDDSDPSVRLAAAVAIVEIARLDQASLANASVDWAEAALRSEDWAVRGAAAQTVGDLPEQEAVPLLAQAIADKSPEVRIRAAIGARRLRGKTAASTVAAALANETDKSVQEQQVKALGAIGERDVSTTLEGLADPTTRVGLMAVGALIALGHMDLVGKLEAALDDHSAALRLAAVDAAMLAGNAAVVPLLVHGLADRDASVRLSAAVALAQYRAHGDEAVPVLQKTVTSSDPLLSGRARAALIRFGATPPDPTVSELLDSSDARVRLTAIDALVAMGWEEAQPLLRRAIYDPDPATRQAAVDAIASHTEADKEELVTLYKLVIKHPDPVCRAKGQAQLARLLDPSAADASATALDTDVVKRAATLVRTAHEELVAAHRTLEDGDSHIRAIIGRAPKNDDELDQVESMVEGLSRALESVRTAGDKVTSGAQTFEALIVGDVPAELAQVVAETRALIEASKELVEQANQRVHATDKAASKYVRDQTADPVMLLASADTSISIGRLAEGQRDLLKAQRAYERRKTSNPLLYFSFGRLYEAMAAGASSGKSRTQNLQKAKKSYDRFIRSGKGFNVAEARKRSAAIAAELAKAE